MKQVIFRSGLTALLLALCSTIHAAELPYDGDGHIMLDPRELQWQDITSMAPPAKIAVIEGDLGSEEPFTFRLRLPPDYRIEPHTHPEYERVTVISGELHFAHGEEFDRERTRPLGPGAIAIMAPGEPMFGYTERETIIQLHGRGPWGIEYVNPEDDPRNE